MTDTPGIKTAFKIYIDGIKYYFKYFPVFVKYMTFPVLGQIAGLAVIAVTTAIYLSILPPLTAKYQIFQTTGTVLAASILITIPGLVFFLQAFWKYLAAYAAISSMTANMIKSGNIYDIEAHNALVYQNAFQYILLWLILGIFSALAVFPVFWIPAIILLVYFVFIFQVFALDTQNAAASFKKSFELVSCNFAATFFLLILVFLTTYIIIPEIFCIITEKLGLAAKLICILNISNDTAIITAPITVTAGDLAVMAINALVSTILVCYTLPIRSITWTLWYKKLASKYLHGQKISKRNGQKKLDRRILDRALEDDL